MPDQVVAVVPHINRRVFVRPSQGKGKDFKNPSLCAKWLEEHRDGDFPTIISPMGGPGDPFLIGLADRGFPVRRIPIFLLQQTAGLGTKASPEDRAYALQSLFRSNPDLFYPIRALDPNMVFARQYARQRLGIQDQRKTATLRIHSALRDFAQVLPPDAAQLIEFLDDGLKDLFKKPALRKQIEDEFKKIRSFTHLTSEQKARILSIRLYQSPESVLGPKREEEALERTIVHLLDKTAIWDALREEGLNIPRCMGMGPALAGAIIGEIGDIRRFSSPGKLRSYALFGLVGGKFPRRQAGQVHSGNANLHRAVWIWSTDQVERYDHVWRDLYLVRKAHEMQVHPEPVPREVKKKSGGMSTVYDYTLKHLDSRTARWVGSKFLEYFWELWTALEEGRDPETWYVGSRWPAYFVAVKQELPAAKEYLALEIPKRRRADPKAEKDDEAEDNDDEADEALT